ncbi:hypothetical protein SCAB_64711 [Streptomyces scabiei 87.22]|uniref:Uncharacterized protein n=1 Tax=Streptomyces scabiei (strain 87.22) TaxID=680198 RepID=C9ZE42_STRSW|nr:hypothetical protein [Streptomyces scabiei]MBP5931888.1 hypothetical protein [Streptomyces sp. LBUM 1479]MDX3052934.1 hypothetical protein [Streptomyces scabiei]MDX3078725.1 hypothetical protein [Streptomyces scabiei]MDX3177549.1 hypothetical protein [Streptomyces scabiei]MDX3271204.1 hypothetical protein [Streptomyces scabiei]
MSAVDQHAEAHRLRDEDGYGARRIAAELGITRHAATRLLAQPLPQPVADQVAEVAAERLPVADQVAEVAAQERPVAEPVAELAVPERPVAARVAEVADQRPPVAVGAVVPSGQVAEATGVARLFRLPGSRSPWLQVDLSGRPWLLRDLMRLVRLGLQIPHVVDIAVRSFAAAYWEAVTGGHLAPGQSYEVQTRVRPCRHAT